MTKNTPVTVWRPGASPSPQDPGKGIGRPPKLLGRGGTQQAVTVKELAAELPGKSFRSLCWRTRSKQPLRSRFAGMRIRPAHRDYERDEPHPQQWLLIEWPASEAEPVTYWLANLSPATQLKDLVALAKQRWIIERDYQELKQEVGLGHYEGRDSAVVPPQAPAALPPARDARCVPSSIIRPPSPPRTSRSHTTSCASLTAVPSVVLKFYDAVVLARFSHHLAKRSA